MRSATLVPDPAVMTLEAIQPEASSITFIARASRAVVSCPNRYHPSGRVHSWYIRHLNDLPWQSLTVRLRLQTRRWFCDTPPCPRRVFTDRLPTVALPHSRHTTRLATILFVFSVAVGGAPAAHLLRELGIAVRCETLRRAVRGADVPDAATPRVLGVDDWSLRTGRNSGTSLVDLERRRPIDLLPDRSAASFAQWLTEHQGIEIPSRDRGGA